MLYSGVFLLVFIGFIHSYLGERMILIRLFKRENLPKLLGSDWFTKRVLRFAWHITTVAWWGFAGILYVIANPSDNTNNEILQIISLVFFISGMVSAVFSKLKHFSWFVFLIISGLSFYAAVYS
jgi:hypothetical protein